jgi:hypothetical protein
MPPSPFARDRQPSGFAAALQSLFGALGKGAYEYRAYQRYGPAYAQELKKQMLAEQESELSNQQKQAALDYAPVQRRSAELENETRKAALAKALMGIGADAMQGQPDEVADVTSVPTGAPGMGMMPLVSTKEAPPPEFDPAMVAASGTPLATIQEGARGLGAQSKLQLALLQAQARKDAAAASAGAAGSRQDKALKARRAIVELEESGRNNRFNTGEAGRNSRFSTGQAATESRFSRAQEALAARIGDAEARRLAEAFDRGTRADLTAHASVLSRQLAVTDDDDARASLEAQLALVSEKLATKQVTRPTPKGPGTPPPPPGSAHPPGAFVMRNGAKTGVPWDKLTPEEQRAAMGGQ